MPANVRGRGSKDYGHDQRSHSHWQRQFNENSIFKGFLCTIVDTIIKGLQGLSTALEGDHNKYPSPVQVSYPQSLLLPQKLQFRFRVDNLKGAPLLMCIASLIHIQVPWSIHILFEFFIILQKILTGCIYCRSLEKRSSPALSSGKREFTMKTSFSRLDKPTELLFSTEN